MVQCSAGSILSRDNRGTIPNKLRRLDASAAHGLVRLVHLNKPVDADSAAHAALAMLRLFDGYPTPTLICNWGAHDAGVDRLFCARNSTPYMSSVPYEGLNITQYAPEHGWADVRPMLMASPTSACRLRCLDRAHKVQSTWLGFVQAVRTAGFKGASLPHCTRTGLTLRYLHRDGARPCHDCTGTRLGFVQAFRVAGFSGALNHRSGSVEAWSAAHGIGDCASVLCTALHAAQCMLRAV